MERGPIFCEGVMGGEGYFHKTKIWQETKVGQKWHGVDINFYALYEKLIEEKNYIVYIIFSYPKQA